MSKVYDKTVVVRKKPDGSCTLSLKQNDKTVIVKSVTPQELVQLKLDIEKELDL